MLCATVWQKVQNDWVSMKKQFRSQHTWSMHKAQSHQVESNWLQLFNFFFLLLFSVSFAHFSIGLSVNSSMKQCVCVFISEFVFRHRLSIFRWKSQLRIRWSTKQSTQKVATNERTRMKDEGKNGKNESKKEEKKDLTENLSISTATVPQIYQFQGMCNMCVLEQKEREPKHPK